MPVRALSGMWAGKKPHPNPYKNQHMPHKGIKFPLRQCVIEQARQIAECVRSGHAGYRSMGLR